MSDEKALLVGGSLLDVEFGLTLTPVYKMRRLPPSPQGEGCGSFHAEKRFWGEAKIFNPETIAILLLTPTQIPIKKLPYNSKSNQPEPTTSKKFEANSVDVE